MISLHTQENLIEFDQQVLVSLLRLFHAQFGQDDDVSLDGSLQELCVQRHLYDYAEYENDFFVCLLFCIDKSSKKVNRLLKRHMVSGSRSPIDDIIVWGSGPGGGQWRMIPHEAILFQLWIVVSVLRSGRDISWPERADFRPKKVGFRSKRGDFRPGKANLRLGRTDFRPKKVN